jgi:hypothetical protein
MYSTEKVPITAQTQVAGDARRRLQPGSVLRTLFGRVELGFLGRGDFSDLGGFLDRHIEHCGHLVDRSVCAAAAYWWDVSHGISPKGIKGVVATPPNGGSRLQENHLAERAFLQRLEA